MPNNNLSFQRYWNVQNAFQYSVTLPQGNSFSAFSGEYLIVPFILTMDESPDNYTPEPYLFELTNDVADGEIQLETFTPTNFIPTSTGALVTVTLQISEGVEHQATFTQNYQFTNGQGTNVQSGSLRIEVIPSFQAKKEDGALAPVIHNGDVMRVLTGATGLIDSKPVKGMWLGYINRTFYNKTFEPEPKFYFEVCNLAKPGEFGDVLSFKEMKSGGAYTTDRRFYRLCFIYDGNQRGMLGTQMLDHTYNGVADDPDTTGDEYAPKYGILKWEANVNKVSKRVTEIECYRSQYKTHGWERIANIPIADTGYSKPGGEQGNTTPTTFTGSTDHNEVFCTDIKPTGKYEDGEQFESKNVLGWDGGEQSYFKAFFGNQCIRNLDTNRRRGTGQAFDGWDTEFMNKITVQMNNGTTESAPLISEVNFRDTDGHSKNLSDLGATAKTMYDWTLVKNTVNLFDDTIVFEGWHWQWNWLYIGGKWVKGGGWDKTFNNCFGGSKLVYCTTTTGVTNSLVGKSLKYENDFQLITGNKGNFIQLQHGFQDGLSGKTFTVAEDVVGTTYSQSGDTITITWNDQAQTSLGEHPLINSPSIDVNGDFAKVVNGRLFQGNIVLDPFGASERHTDWISYSELGQPDVNPVSNVVRFVDREGGAITGLDKIMDRLVVLKEQAMFMINCPANVSPVSWTQVESIHNIGNIAPRGVISSGDQLFTVFYDGIYKLTANNMADSDKTPTERLKITDQIQDIYDEVHDKKDITSQYDQYNNEVLFTWVRGNKNLVKNGSFHSQKYWDFGKKADLDDATNSIDGVINGKYCGTAIANDSSNSPTEGSFYSDYIEITDQNHYCISVYGRVPIFTVGRFYANFLFYNKQKEHIGGYPTLCTINTEQDDYIRYYKNLRPYNDAQFDNRVNPSNEMQIPLGARYIRCRSYWWSNATLGEPFPMGFGETDDWMLEKTDTSINQPSTYETQESEQEIWAYSLVNGAWRQVDVESAMGFLEIDEKANVIGYDESSYKIRAFSEPEAVKGKIRTHPVVINEERTDVVRKIKSKFNSSDNLTIRVIPDGDSTKTQTRTLTGTGNVKSERKRVKTRCQTFEVEIETPDTTNDMEIHNYSVDFT